MSDPTPALDYGTLRMIAECALGIGNQAVEFAVTPGTDGGDEAVTRLPPATPLPDSPQSVLIPAQSTGNYYPSVQVGLELAWTGPRGTVSGTVVAGPLDAALNASADAVFWSDAAVQKFVVPYVASCTAWGAASTLTELRNAWNQYPADQMAVFALLHLVPAQGAPVGVESVLGLAVGTPSGVQTETLSTYLQNSRGTAAVLAEEPPLVPFTQVVPLAPFQYPDYTFLRGIAEWSTLLTATTGPWLPGTEAPEFTGPGFFGWEPGQPEAGTPTQEQEGFGIPAYNPQVPANRPPPLNVTFTGTDGRQIDLTNYVDAAFWSPASIQQFVLPYYASVGGFQEPGIVQDIVSAWLQTGPAVMDGLVHLPNSAWVWVDEVTQLRRSTLWQTLTPEHQLKLERYHQENMVNAFRPSAHVGVLYRDEWGRHLLPLLDFKVLYPGSFR